MTNERFGLAVATWLDEEARHRVPDHLDAVLAVTKHTRQRPAWSSLERWLPVDTTLRPALSFVRPARLLIVGALLLVLVALAVFAIGSRPRLPEPFGPTRNGLFVSSGDGDIVRLDPSTGDPTPLVAVESFDFSPVFSRDGTKFMFLRSEDVPGDPAILTLMVANADGSDVRALTPAMKALDWFDWSPDGSQIAFVSDGVPYVVDVAGGGQARLPVRDQTHFVTWLPPGGDRLVFRAEGFRPAIFSINPDGTGLDQVTPDGTSRSDYVGLAVSPDGARLSYSRRINNLPQIFTLDLATGEEMRLPNGDGVAQIEIAPFSPDGLSVAYARRYADGEYQVVVAPSDGSDDGRVLGPRMPSPAPDVGVNVWIAFTPDGASLLVRYGGDESGITQLLPIDGSAGRTIRTTGAFVFVDVQRVAP